MKKYKKIYQKYKLKGKENKTNSKKLKHEKQTTPYSKYIEDMICGNPIDDNPTTISKFCLFVFLLSTISKSFPQNLF